MTETPNPNNDWTECPPGEIAGLVKHLKSKRRRKTFQQAAGVTSAILVLAFFATGFVSGWFHSAASIPEIACEQVHELAPRYVKGQTEEPVTARIDRHLKACPNCRDHFRLEFPEFPLPEKTEKTADRPCSDSAVLAAGEFGFIGEWNSPR